MEFLVINRHPPNLCPGANDQIRSLAQRSLDAMPALAERLSVQVTATYVSRTNHMILVALSADRVETVEEFVSEARFAQWNTCEIHLVSTLEETLAHLANASTIY